MKKRILFFLVTLVLSSIAIPLKSVKAIIYKPGDYLSNGFPAPIAYSPHHLINEINPWSDEIHVELEYELNRPSVQTDYTVIGFWIYSQKDTIDDERFQTEESRDINIKWLLPIQIGYWADLLGQYEPETKVVHHEFDLKLSESLDQRNSDIIYFGERFESPSGTGSYKTVGKIEYSECKQQILSGEVDSVICEATLVAKEDLRYQAKTMSLEELESPEYREFWEKVKSEREELKNEELKKYYEQIESIRQRIEELRSELAQSMIDTTTIQESLENLKVILGVIDGSEELIKVIEQLQEEITSIQNTYDTEKVYEQLQIVLDTQTKLQLELSELKDERETLKKQLEEEKDIRSELEVQIEKLKSENSALSSELELEKNKKCDCEVDNKDDKDDKNDKEDNVLQECPSTSIGGTSGSLGGNDGIVKRDEDIHVSVDKNDATNITSDELLRRNEQELALTERQSLYVGSQEQISVLGDNDSSNTEDAKILGDTEFTNVGDGDADSTITPRDDIEVPNLGSERNVIMYLLLPLLLIIGFLVYLIKKKLRASGRDQGRN